MAKSTKSEQRTNAQEYRIEKLEEELGKTEKSFRNQQLLLLIVFIVLNVSSVIFFALSLAYDNEALAYVGLNNTVFALFICGLACFYL